MKVSSLAASLALSLAFASAAPNQEFRVASVDAQPTDGPVLEKRFKDVIVNKHYKELESLRAHGSVSATNTLKPWVRTIYGSKVEIVTPTVVAGVTISAKPPATTNGLEPWISLNKDGSPKTIKPKMKNGVIKDKSPDYGTYFQTATTVRYTKEELQAHNMKEDEVFDEETYIEEDLTYRSLNPIIRCTPESYKMKGLGKDKSPEPFCFPRDNTRLYQERTYFVTWYHRFFADSVKNVKLHLSYVRESARQKGTKRDLIEGDLISSDLTKRSTIIEQGGSLGEASFFASEWMPKEEGIFPIEINPDWLQEEYYKKVLISLQPDNVSDDEFDHMSNFIVIEIAQRAKVAKGHAEDITKQEERQRMKALYGDSYDVEEGIDYEKYIIIMTMPTCVLLAVVFMYLFVWYNSRDHDLSFLKKVKFAKKKSTKLPFRRKKESKYTELPQWDGPKSD
ncbi:hypothetical protein OXX59_007856 [Metschnikowia pulcherrima]